jgi:hypothetical protein
MKESAHDCIYGYDEIRYRSFLIEYGDQIENACLAW